MTQEEKAKAYDEAYKKVAVRFGSNVADEIFLKESEDERIRKEILDCAKAMKADRWIAWLEKQGEQKPSTDFSDIRSWKYIVDAVLTEKEGIGQYLDSPFTEEIAKKLQKRFGNIEQKPAWSEEDEKMINKLIDFMLSGIDISKAPYGCVAWLKSLKDRYTWKPSDEQMNTLEYYMHSLICNKHKEILFGLYADLKNLREE